MLIILSQDLKRDGALCVHHLTLWKYCCFLFAFLSIGWDLGRYNQDHAPQLALWCFSLSEKAKCRFRAFCSFLLQKSLCESAKQQGTWLAKGKNFGCTVNFTQTLRELPLSRCISAVNRLTWDCQVFPESVLTNQTLIPFCPKPAPSLCSSHPLHLPLNPHPRWIS